MIDTKRCPQCSTVKPVEEFAGDRTKRDGHKTACKACDRARSTAYYRAHRAARLEYFRAVYIARRAPDQDPSQEAR